MPTCAICNSENPAGKKFCGECGAALGDRCPHCGADNPAGKKFCGDCGTALVAAGEKPHSGNASVSPEASAAVAAETGQPYFDGDLHRLDGDLLLATGGTADEAAAHYQRALAIAREQGSRSFELRAATSLARLWRDQGKRAEARELLAPVYAWFTAGFDTRDLIEAKVLREDLG